MERSGIDKLKKACIILPLVVAVIFNSSVAAIDRENNSKLSCGIDSYYVKDMIAQDDHIWLLLHDSSIDKDAVACINEKTLELQACYRSGEDLEDEMIIQNKWYDAYLNYCVKNRIVSSGEYSSLDAYATRAQIAHIFAKATSDFAVVNDIDYDYIPDVSERSEYADEILALYRAGILTGDERTRAFRPSDTITRAEAAAIISRVALPTTRIKIV